MSDPNIGRVLANRYRLVELVGKGAMGRVYRAEDDLLGGVIAVKFLAQTLLNAKMRDRFYLEARTCAQLGQKSIHIVRVTDFGVDEDDIPFYVMEYLHGESLSELINAGPLPLPRFLAITRQIALGLQCAHQGILIDDQLCPIIHRDIKPSNILVTKDTSLGELVKILDFGIIKLLQSDAGQTNSYMGTLAYSSPEQMEGRELDARSDIYSLGVMMFEMLTGRMPLQAETHSFGGWYKTHHYQQPRTIESVNPTLKLPKVLENLVMSCLSKLPTDRPQSAGDIIRTLEPLEQRYSASRQISYRIGEALAKSLPTLEPETTPVAPEDELPKIAIWPKDKPVAQIVFPHTLATSSETVVTLWAMLPEQEIQNLQMHKLYNRIYKNFLCTMSPHPVVLWITALYNRLYSQSGPRWLRCFLDLKTSQGEEMLRLLAEQGKYQVLLFSLENPSQSPHLITVKLNPNQCLQLQQWMITSKTWVSVGQSATSKQVLQTEFERLKPKITEDLERGSTGSSLNLRSGNQSGSA